MFMEALHLSGPSLRHWDDCPGDNHVEKSTRVTDALRAWVTEHGLAADFQLEVTIGQASRHPSAYPSEWLSLDDVVK